MRFARILALSVLLALPAAAHDPGYRFADVVVESVYDGDTLRVSLPGVHPLWGDRVLVRFSGIDAPELRGACDAERAAAKSARDRLLSLVRHVRVDLEGCGREKFGRLLCRVMADGRDVALVLVAEGHARVYEGGARGGWCE